MLIENGLSFVLNEDSRQLDAIFVPNKTDKIKFTVALIKQWLSEENFLHLFISESSLFKLVHTCNTAVESFRIKLGELKDASCEITISEDEMTATLTFFPAFGGKTLTLGDVHRCLQQAGITYGLISDQKIEQFLNHNQASELIVAMGLLPVAGEDAKFESLIPQRVKEPCISEQGTVDYRNLGEIITVQEGQLVMRRIPAKPGQKGCNVFGDLIDYYHGLDIPFSSNKKGVYIDPNDNKCLCSELIGTPVLIPHGVIVLPVLTLKCVDFKSGNVSFSGGVVIKGDVENGMKVYALNDLVIEGNVENADLECGGCLTILGCVQNSRLKAGGNINLYGGVNASRAISHSSIETMFAEYSDIEAGVDITVCDYSLSSGLFAGNKITIGKKGKRKSLVGGIAWAMLEVKASVFGTTTETITRIRVGSDPRIQKMIDELNNSLATNDNEQNRIKKLIVHIGSKEKSAELTKLNNRLDCNLHKLVSEKEFYDKELAVLYDNLAMIQYAKVIAESRVNIGCEIQISQALLKTDKTLGRSVFRESRGEIHVVNKLQALLSNKALDRNR
ncbi:MAG: FapA family protein [Methylococcales bacterium]|nr:FapA family protein [Methylococcales bacterium]